MALSRFLLLAGPIKNSRYEINKTFEEPLNVDIEKILCDHHAYNDQNNWPSDYFHCDLSPMP